MKKVCEECIHFIQHYYKEEKDFNKVYCGHCIYPRIKKRKPNDSACDFFNKKVHAQTCNRQ